MKRLFLAALLVGPAYLTLQGCGGLTQDAATDTNTNWLKACTKTSQCSGDAECLCGICTLPCLDDATCGEAADAESLSCLATAHCEAAQRVCATPEAAKLVEAYEKSVVENAPDDSTAAPDAGTVDGCDLPARSYKSRDSAMCAVLTFGCATNESPFADDCGCGCETVEPPASDPACDDPARRYITEGPDSCVGADIVCDLDELFFEDDCGCGCEADSILPPPGLPEGCGPVEEPSQECDLYGVRWVVGPDCNADVNVACRGEETVVESAECGIGCMSVIDACALEGRRYVAAPGGACEDIECGEGHAPFDDACGCGCSNQTAADEPDLTEAISCTPEGGVSTAERYYTTQGREFCTVGAGCFADEVGFRDACGCGCERVGEECRQPGRSYLSLSCAGADFICPEGQEGFDEPCGCGCEANVSDCKLDGRRYVTYDANDDECEEPSFGCAPEETLFVDDCGCGCEVK